MNSSNSWKLFCEAEAKPEPNITWWNPQGLLLNASQMFVDTMDLKKPQKINSSLSITNKLLEENYKCLVQNKHGADHKFVYFGQKPQKVPWTMVLWAALLSLVLLILLLTVGLFICKKKYKNQGEKSESTFFITNLCAPELSFINMRLYLVSLRRVCETIAMPCLVCLCVSTSIYFRFKNGSL